MRTSVSAVVFAAVLSSFAVSSFAQTTEPAPATGGKGERFAAKLDEKFKGADANGDGQLTKDEMTKGMPRMASHFDEIDTNKDGFVTEDEIKAYAQSRRGSRKGS
jgi:Ca2+-binding EF-hand superfamily protein